MMANKVLIVWSFLHLRYPFPPLFTPGLHSTLTTWVILLVSEPIKHAPICLGAFSTNSNASEFFLHTNNSITKTLLKCPLLSETYPNYPFKNYKLFHISIYSCLKNKFIYLFIFGCTGSSLLRVGFSLVAVSGGYSSLRCIGFSCNILYFKVYFIWYEYCYSCFLLISIFMEYLFPSPHFQSVCVPRSEVGLL